MSNEEAEAVLDALVGVREGQVRCAPDDGICYEVQTIGRGVPSEYVEVVDCAVVVPYARPVTLGGLRVVSIEDLKTWIVQK